MTITQLAEWITKYGSIAAEIFAAVIICISLIKALVSYSWLIIRPQGAFTPERIRLNFGKQVSLALEILIAADVLATAISPSWDELGKLGAIVLIRTILNFFLEKELHRLKISD